MTPVISIIIPLFYSSNKAKKALTMLSWQTCKNDIEVILVNDCSPHTDCEYQDLLNEFSNQLNIKYLKTPYNGGPGLARQIGLNYCRSPWVMFHDDDDILNTPYVIEAFLEIINNISSNEIISTIYGPQLQFWPGEKNLFLKTDANVIGCRLFNVNLIKLFNIPLYNELFFEEDFLFFHQYCYHIEKMKILFPQLKIRDIDITWTIPNFISYVRMRNENSLCETLDRSYQINPIKYLIKQFTFYLNLPYDITINSITTKFIIGHMKYVSNVVESLNPNHLIPQVKDLLFKLNTIIQQVFNIHKVNCLNNYCEIYNNFISQLYTNDSIE